MIPWVEFGLGAWAVQGGIHALPQALAKLAGELGVTFHFSTPVQAIEHEGNRIKGIRVKDEVRPFDVVVSNTEVKRTYRLLEAGGPLGRRSQAWRRKYEEGQPSTSGVVFLWGMDTNFAELGHHNVFFSPDYNAEFLAMFDEGRLADDPTVYVNITCKDTPTDAPPGQENWFVLVNAPNDTGPVRKTGTEALARLRQAALGRIEANLGREVRSHIVQEQVLSLGESLYGLASHSALAAFDRHPNRAPGLKGLYLCGGSVHPGGGMPLATLSGKIAAELATKDFPLVQQKDGTP